MKIIQFSSTEVNLTVSAISSMITTELNKSPIDFATVGKLTAIQHKLVTAEDTVGQARPLEKIDA